MNSTTKSSNMAKWNGQLDDILRAYHAEGFSFTIIGEKMGMSRSAIAGRCNRLGLFRGDPPIHSRQPKKRVRIFKFPVPKRPELSEPDVGAVEAILSTSPRTCRYPIGDPKESNFRFCSKDKSVDQSYCEEHQNLVYNRSITR